MTKHVNTTTADDVGPFARTITCTIDTTGILTLDTRECYGDGAWQEAADIEVRLVNHGLCVRVVDAFVAMLAQRLLPLCRAWDGQVPIDGGTVPRRRRS